VLPLLALSPPNIAAAQVLEGSCAMPGRRASVGCRCCGWVSCAWLCCTGQLRPTRQPAPALFPDPTCCLPACSAGPEPPQQAAGQNCGGGVQVGATAAGVWRAGRWGNGCKCAPGTAGDGSMLLCCFGIPPSSGRCAMHGAPTCACTVARMCQHLHSFPRSAVGRDHLAHGGSSAGGVRSQVSMHAGAAIGRLLPSWFGERSTVPLH
jgi:hypothetical protein